MEKLNNTKSNIDYIVFAIKQAKEAEAFGFTRNEACRNLKTALHQYWQHKTLKQHGDLQKLNLPRSAEAQGKTRSEIDVDHVVPQMVIVNMLMDLDDPDAATTHNLLKKYFHVCCITKEEHQRLSTLKLRYTMPADWDGENVYARYEKAKITLAFNLKK